MHKMNFTGHDKIVGFPNLVTFIKSTQLYTLWYNSVQWDLDYLNLDYPNPQLSEHSSYIFKKIK